MKRKKSATPIADEALAVFRDGLRDTTAPAVESALDFLRRAADGRHRIVSSGDLTALQIAEAQAERRFYVEPGGGLGWALLPWNLRAMKDDLREAGIFSKGEATCAHCNEPESLHPNRTCALFVGTRASDSAPEERK